MCDTHFVFSLPVSSARSFLNKHPKGGSGLTGIPSSPCTLGAFEHVWCMPSLLFPPAAASVHCNTVAKFKPAANLTLWHLVACMLQRYKTAESHNLLCI
jgi:hypothetical protein